MSDINKSATSLLVAEQFYSLQGEGKSAGVPCNFIRLAGCNLMCGGPTTHNDGLLSNGATWRCDTIEVWMQGLRKEFSDIHSHPGFNVDCRRIVITGGEPLMQQQDLEAFIEWLNEGIIDPYFIELETNGTIMPSNKMLDLVDQWNISPKLANSGMRETLRFKPEVLKAFVNHAHCQFKFVVNKLAHIREMIEQFSFIPPSLIWLMPGASTEDELKENAQATAEQALHYGFNFSNRMHIQLWNVKTGK